MMYRFEFRGSELENPWIMFNVSDKELECMTTFHTDLHSAVALILSHDNCCPAIVRRVAIPKKLSLCDRPGPLLALVHGLFILVQSMVMP